jgi:phosphoribosylformylglycinamidine synthase
LNFGNPYKPENFWQLREAVEGVSEACREFGTPVTGGNVSLYNESPAGVVDPTATVAMVGLVADERHITTQFFKAAGDTIILIGDVGHELGGSRFLKVCYERKEGLPPRLHYDRELAVQKATRKLIGHGFVRSAHDCSEGGIMTALAECCFNPAGVLGAEVDLGTHDRRLDQVLFNESQSRILISVSPENADRVLGLLKGHEIPHHRLGTVGGESLIARVSGAEIRWPIAELYDDWYFAIARAVATGD